MEVNYPKVKQSIDKRVFVEFYQENKRYRLFNGKKLNIDIHPNTYPVGRRVEIGYLLAAEVYRILSKGISLVLLKTTKHLKPNMTALEYLKVALDKKNYTLIIQRNTRVCCVSPIVL
jgi:hypothetical protein